jgi:hypothetical protein
MCCQQGVASDLRSHLAIAQDKMWQDRKDGFARRALYPPDRDSAKTDAHIMGVARQASSPATGRFVFQLKAKSEEKGENTFDKRLAIAKQLKVSSFILEIDGDGAVVAGLMGCGSHGSSSGPMVRAADDPTWRNTSTISRSARRAEIRHHYIRWNVDFSRSHFRILPPKGNFATEPIYVDTGN